MEIVGKVTHPACMKSHTIYSNKTRYVHKRKLYSLLKVLGHRCHKASVVFPLCVSDSEDYPRLEINMLRAELTLSASTLAVCEIGRKIGREKETGPERGEKTQTETKHDTW